MRWLLLKDLQILRRSPLLVALLVIYPVVLALLIGSALSSSPGQPTLAIYNGVPKQDRTFDVAGSSVNADEFLPELSRAVDVIDADSREDALRMVRDGEAMAAVILPPDIADRLASGRSQPTVEVAYNTEDPVKQQAIESQLKARLSDANRALSRKYEETTVRYIEMLRDGGSISILGNDVSILGLKTSQRLIEGVMATLPRDSPSYTALAQVDRFARLAIQNLGLSTEVLRSVGEPIAVRQTLIGGRRTPLDRYAIAVALTVSLMFLTVLLASGLLALEREEHAFSRLVRGLVSRLGLLVAKSGLAALCGAVVTLLLLTALDLFWVDLDAGRAPWWLPALALGALAFAALGVAIGTLAREVRSASLLAFTLSLPVAFLALVPSSAVSGWAYDVIRVVCAIFPFKATLTALDVAVNDAPGSFATPLLHLAALAVGYVVVARLALRRFA
ncbi:ABC transporter permease [Conexibacter sp. JD483]|uniref:ABC transporter permease n=1 Tax=unclassified Conexibacter TaxID=2627773 RepID=UPI002726A578|nr:MULTISPECIES: ABC transporter permease [unclassified Conexibacter]MDO8184428.1 ABC transporter permease [Conexibacter sp. CPCC 205706]MDO8197734.1 ABC transporter permease [Conexibacter sp. CPCC 205762]MDR9368130.1 ABC transporter permease [Conexibacter sp. JD483]